MWYPASFSLHTQSVYSCASVAALVRKMPSKLEILLVKEKRAFW